MLRAGAGKAPRAVVSPVVADALDLPLADASASGAIVAFGIRNVADLDAGLREVHRVLAPGARFVILEFTTPRSRVVRSLYHLYFHHVLPRDRRTRERTPNGLRLSSALSGEFSDRGATGRAMHEAGFVDVEWHTLTFGVAAIHRGTKRVAAH